MKIKPISLGLACHILMVLQIRTPVFESNPKLHFASNQIIGLQIKPLYIMFFELGNQSLKLTALK